MAIEEAFPSFAHPFFFFLASARCRFSDPPFYHECEYKKKDGAMRFIQLPQNTI